MLSFLNVKFKFSFTNILKFAFSALHEVYDLFIFAIHIMIDHQGIIQKKYGRIGFVFFFFFFAAEGMGGAVNPPGGQG